MLGRAEKGQFFNGKAPTTKFQYRWSYSSLNGKASTFQKMSACIIVFHNKRIRSSNGSNSLLCFRTSSLPSDHSPKKENFRII